MNENYKVLARVSSTKGSWGRGGYNLDGIARRKCYYIAKIHHTLFKEYANVVALFPFWGKAVAFG